MTKYCIVAAHPKGASNHINSQFKLFELNDKGKWESAGWKSIGKVCDLIQAGDEVLTGKIVNNN